MGVKVRQLVDQKQNALQDVALIPAGVVTFPTTFNKVITNETFATASQLLRERSTEVNKLRSIYIDSMHYVNQDHREGTNHTLYGELPIPSILPPSSDLNVVLYKYNGIKIHPLDKDIQKPDIFTNSKVQRLYALDVINSQDQVKAFADSYNATDSTEIINIPDTDTYYITGSLPYQHLITKDYAVNAELKNRNINRLYSIFETAYNYDTRSSIETSSFSGTKLSIIRDRTSLPAEYQEVEYLESNGFQYINFDYAPSSAGNFEIRVKYYISDISKRYAIASNYNSLDGCFSLELNSGSISGKGRFYYKYGSGSTIDIFTNNTMKVGFNDITYKLVDSTASIILNGVETVDPNAPGTYAGFSTHPLYMFLDKENRSNIFTNKLRIYSFKVKDNGEYVRDLVPCYRKSDSKKGMYDRINNKFYETSYSTISSNDKEFTKGENVYNGYLADLNGKYLAKVSAFTVRNVAENFKAYLNLNGIEIPMRTTRLSGKNHNCIYMVKFPRYLLDADIDIYNSIRYIRFENYYDNSISFATWKTILRYGEQAFVKKNDKTDIGRIYGDSSNEYISKLNIYDAKNYHGLSSTSTIGANDGIYKVTKINTYLERIY